MVHLSSSEAPRVISLARAESAPAAEVTIGSAGALIPVLESPSVLNPFLTAATDTAALSGTG